MTRIIIALLLFAATCLSVFAGSIPLLHVGLAGASVSNLTTPIFSSVLLPNTGTSAEFGGTQSTTALNSQVYSTSGIARQVPLPFAGTVSTLNCHLGVANSSITMLDNINGADGSIGCDFTDGNQNHTSTGTNNVSAGNIFQWHWANNGLGPAWNQGTTPSQFSFLYQSSNGQHAAIFFQPTNQAVGATTSYYGFPSGSSGTSETGLANILCSICGGVINGFYAIPNANENASTHAYTLIVNGSASSMTCTGSAGRAGCCVNANASPGTMGYAGIGVATCTTVAPITVNPGDSLSVQVSCPVCSSPTPQNIIPGVGVDFIPATTNVVPVFTYSTTATNSFSGVSDASVAASQTNYQTIPASMTFSHLQICSLLATTGSQTRQVALQYGASPGTAPTTSAGPVAQATNGTGACTGAMSGTYLSGFQDNTDTFAATAGQTVDFAATFTNTPSSTALKFSAAVTVP